jgi:hypothetical protein
VLAQSVKKGIPEGYAAALKQAGFSLPSPEKEMDHSILQHLSAWIVHKNNKIKFLFTMPHFLWEETANSEFIGRNLLQSEFEESGHVLTPHDE